MVQPEPTELVVPLLTLTQFLPVNLTRSGIILPSDVEFPH